MSLWIPVTIAAAVFQTVRFMLQKYLSTGHLSAAGATFARFLFSAPFILAGLGIFLFSSGTPLPPLQAAFWGYAMMGGVAQILATVCVVLLFKQRNFAVGITFKKTEVIQTVIVGLILLGEGVSTGGLVAILLGLVGVFLLSRAPGMDGAWWRHMTNRASALGLGSGVLFAVSAVSYRGATLQLGVDDAVLRAGITLAAVVSFQTLVMVVWLLLRDPGQIGAVWRTRRVGLWIGLTSMGGSLCWFIAFALQNAAYVKALGQVELLLSLLASVFVFKEKISGRELGGMAFLVASILLIVLLI